ncbi:TetR/AcrR family transcriptional regulator [Bradyrhizobium prioriisuperbiae]|uniref:TetR/AcrR family transcriptional regulator n=1 Tax=Bradyrhizobium prioriisuperbiae TaxID=2854389 RepID=UPI0028F0790D|nr:TetR/AcrR family transcriptional regulator [Bradyrhizobium prioritasuperba]
MKATQDGSAETDERRFRGRPQARPDEETRIIIYEAARHLFAVGGFAATSMEMVARSAGVSTKTLYRLVPNKSALFEGTVSDRMDRFLSAVNLRAAEHEDIEVALRTALLTCAELVLDEEVISLNRMMIAESDRFPEISATFYQKAMRRTVAAFADWLRVRRDNGAIVLDDVDEAAGMLLGMMVFEPQRAALFGHQPAPSHEAIAERAHHCAALFLRGCGG